MYRLFWQDHVREYLSIRWIVGDRDMRRQIRAAIRETKTLLQTDPFGQGESRDAGRRIMYADPLWITYHIDRQNAIVRVVDISLL